MPSDTPFMGRASRLEIFLWRTTIQLGADETRRAVKDRRKSCPGVKLPLIPLVSPTQRSSSRTGLDHFTAALNCSSAIHGDAAVVHLSSPPRTQSALDSISHPLKWRSSSALSHREKAPGADAVQPSIPAETHPAAGSLPSRLTGGLILHQWEGSYFIHYLLH